jgi:hypothetical protein
VIVSNICFTTFTDSERIHPMTYRNTSGAYEFTLYFSEIRHTQSLAYCVVFCTLLSCCHLHFVLSVHSRFTDSYYPLVSSNLVFKIFIFVVNGNPEVYHQEIISIKLIMDLQRKTLCLESYFNLFNLHSV